MITENGDPVTLADAAPGGKWHLGTWLGVLITLSSSSENRSSSGLWVVYAKALHNITISFYKDLYRCKWIMCTILPRCLLPILP